MLTLGHDATGGYGAHGTIVSTKAQVDPNGGIGADLDAPAAGTSEAITDLFAVAPDFATLSGGDYIKLVLDGNRVPVGVVHRDPSPERGVPRARCTRAICTSHRPAERPIPPTAPSGTPSPR